MSHLWVEFDETSTWSVVPLKSGAVAVVDGRPVAATEQAPPREADALLFGTCPESGMKEWILIAPPERQLRLNGRRLVLGRKVLRDRDEITLPGGRRIYFSSEELPIISIFPGADQEVYCGRCKTVVAAGNGAVCCPRCQTWSHQTEQLPCWHYPGTTTCPVCSQSNAADADFTWSPHHV